MRLLPELGDHLMANTKFEHSQDSKYGENIFSSSSSNPAAAAKLRGGDPVDSWYREINQYK